MSELVKDILDRWLCAIPMMELHDVPAIARRDYGYEDDFYRTSVACRILRENGHRVSDQPDPMEIQP